MLHAGVLAAYHYSSANCMPPLPCLALQEALAAQVAATAASAHAAALHAELSAAQQEVEAARAAAEEQRAAEQALHTELALLQQVWLGEGSLGLFRL